MSKRKNSILLIFTSLFLTLGCKNESNKKASIDQRSNVAIATEFIDAFYSFDKDKLRSTLAYAKDSQQDILYYQLWAACGNYEVLKRKTLVEKNDSLVLCPVTVKDDLIGALEVDFNVTDTFHLTIVNGQIRSVETSSNDPDQYYEAKDWVKQHHPELIEIPCGDSATACDCVKATVEGFKAFNATNKTIK